MECVMGFFTHPYLIGLMIVLVILVYIIKGDVDFMKEPKKIWKLFRWLGCKEKE